jgi:O-antigen ligase
MGSTVTLRNFKNSVKAPAGWAKLNGRAIAVVGLLALLAFVAVPVATNWLGDGDLLMFAGVSVALLLTILVGTIRVSKLELDVLTWKTGLIMWAFLLGSQQFFLRSVTPADEALNYGYDAAAYAEAGTWLAAGLVIFVIAIRSREQLRWTWSGNFKFIVLFTVMCCLSASYSPSRPLAFAWSFKLVLVALALNMCARGMHTAADIRTFLLSTFWGFAMLMVVPVIKGIATGQQAFLPDGRLSYFDHPVHGSQLAGVTLLLALVVFAGRARSVLPWAGISAAIMLVSGGKAGIVAGVLSALLLFGLRGKPGQALLMLVGVTAIGVTVLVYTPVSQYLKIYSESNAAGTLTGRTDLWDASMPMILEKPLLGHGYMSSRFMSLSDRLESFNWQPTQAHNSFLEIAYTNGAVGLILLLTLHYLVVRHLWAAFKQHRLLAAGALVLYVDLLLQSAVEGSVAGKPSDCFMLLLALVMVSEKLVNLTPPLSAARQQLQS